MGNYLKSQKSTFDSVSIGKIQMKDVTVTHLKEKKDKVKLKMKIGKIGKKWESFLSSQNCSYDDFPHQCQPFWPLSMKVSKNWMCCALVSPLTVLVSPLYLLKDSGQLLAKCQMVTFNEEDHQKIEIIDVIEIQKDKICLAVLEKPVFNFGWIQTFYFETKDDIISSQFKIINFPERISERSKLYYLRKVNTLKINNVTSEQNGFFAENNNLVGSIICTEKNGTLFLVGLQINQQTALLFNKKIHNKIKKNIILTLNKNQKTIEDEFQRQSKENNNKQNIYLPN